MCSPHYHGKKIDWQVVSAKKHCPVCGKPDRCGISPDGKLLSCFRREALFSWDGLSWQHKQAYGEKPASPIVGKIAHNEKVNVPAPVRGDNRKKQWDALERYRKLKKKPNRRQAVADASQHLGVPLDGLIDFGVVSEGLGRLIWLEDHKHDGSDAIIGSFCYRSHSENREDIKRAYISRGVSFSRVEGQTVLYAVEGLTDAAVLRGVGLSTIMRPNNELGAAAIVKHLHPGESVVVVAENDQKPDGTWPGKEGAESIAQETANATLQPVRIIYPDSNSKDSREWWHSTQPSDPNNPSESDKAKLRDAVTARMASGDVVQPAKAIVSRWLWDQAETYFHSANAGIRKCKGKCDAMALYFREESQHGERDKAFFARCLRNTTCDYCRPVREDFFASAILLGMSRHVPTDLHCYLVAESNADSLLAAIRYAGGVDADYMSAKTHSSDYPWLNDGYYRIVISTIDLGPDADAKWKKETDFTVAAIRNGWLDCIPEATRRKPDESKKFERFSASRRWRFSIDELKREFAPTEGESSDTKLIFVGKTHRENFYAVAQACGLSSPSLQDIEGHPTIVESISYGLTDRTAIDAFHAALAERTQRVADSREWMDRFMAEWTYVRVDGQLRLARLPISDKDKDGLIGNRAKPLQMDLGFDDWPPGDPPRTAC